jgi:hypothetical protein
LNEGRRVGVALLASGGRFLEGGCRRGIGWVEGFERELRQRDIDGSPKNGRGAEEGKNAGIRAELKRDDNPVVLLIQRRWSGGETGSGWREIAAQLLTQFGEDGISSARDLVMQFVENMGAPFMVVGKARRQPSWMKSEAEDIDRRLQERWSDATEERS